jgi:hypothetical protein
VDVSPLAVAGRTLTFDVGVRALTGHKFPTGYPSRRTWLHVPVKKAAGQMVFESGAVNRDGLIAGNDNDADAARYEPHYTEVSAADQVQIYEAILGDRQGIPTTGLLTATQYLKDNRLLPRGFNKATAGADIAVIGRASEDSDFSGGGDRVRYVVGLPDGAAALQVDVELRYQPIAYRWAHALEEYDAAEPKRFVSYYTSLADSSSVIVARASGR